MVNLAVPTGDVPKRTISPDYLGQDSNGQLMSLQSLYGAVVDRRGSEDKLLKPIPNKTKQGSADDMKRIISIRDARD